MVNLQCGQGYGTGVVADNCSGAATPLNSKKEIEEVAAAEVLSRIQAGRVGDVLATWCALTNESNMEKTKSHSSPVHLSASPTLARSRSYRNIQEVEETTVFTQYHHQSTLNNNSKNTDSLPQRPKNKL